jgi:hypothetical protein
MKSHLTKYRVPATCLVTILLAGVAPAIATAGTTRTHYKTKGLTAYVDSYTFSGSTTTSVSFSATEGLQKDPSTLYLYVSQYDFLANSYTCYQSDPNVGLPLTSPQIQITRAGNTLVSASLNVAGAVLQDCSGNPGNPATATADISITWTGYGPTSTDRYNTRGDFPFPGGVTIFSSHWAGTQRSANAAGTLVVNGTDFFAAVASDPSAYILLQQTSDLEINMTKSF